MQHKQDNYKAWLFGVLLVVLGLVAGQSAYSAGLVQRGGPDPILSGGSEGPCDPGSDTADYVGGTDVNGNPVAPADLAGQPVPVPAQIDVPVRRARGAPAYVRADGKSLAPLLNPPAGCAVRPRAR